MSRIWTALVAFVLAACAPLPPTPQDIQAKRIEAVPDKAVIYIVRPDLDISYLPATLKLDDEMIGTTHAGTYLRLEVPPGRHRISGYAQDTGAITVDVQAGRIYFIEHTVSGSWRATAPHSFLRLIDEARGRAAVQRSTLAG